MWPMAPKGCCDSTPAWRYASNAPASNEAMRSALGVKTSFRDVARAGWQPLLLIVTETLWLAGVMLAGAWWLLGAP